jgi:hypothetical protein
MMRLSYIPIFTRSKLDECCKGTRERGKAQVRIEAFTPFCQRKELHPEIGIDKYDVSTTNEGGNMHVVKRGQRHIHESIVSFSLYKALSLYIYIYIYIDIDIDLDR